MDQVYSLGLGCKTGQESMFMAWKKKCTHFLRTHPSLGANISIPKMLHFGRIAALAFLVAIFLSLEGPCRGPHETAPFLSKLLSQARDARSEMRSHYYCSLSM